MKSEESYSNNMVYTMKTVILFFLIMRVVPEAWGQTQAEFYYDAAGNRTQRKIITMPVNAANSGMNKSATDNNGRTEVPASPETQKYEDMLGERKVVIYPNPTQGMLKIEFQGYGDLKNARLLLYDIQGRLLQQAVGPAPTHTLDLSPFPAGMYILQMTDGTAKSEWKIVKE